LQEGLHESRKEARKESSESRNEARTESSVLQDMMSQLIQHINNNKSTSQTPVTSTEKRKHDAKTTSINPEDKDMTSPEHRKQRQTSALENNTQGPLALNFEQMREDINMDLGGNDEELSVNNSMGTVETPTVVELEEELSITGHDFTNNMDCTSSPVPTTITATNQSNDEFTAVRNGSPNRQSSLERRNTTTTTTTTTTNNRYSAIQTTSTTKESNNNNTTNPSAKDRHDRKND
jgi:hypothetical protein